MTGDLGDSLTVLWHMTRVIIWQCYDSWPGWLSDNVYCYDLWPDSVM